MSKSLLEQAKEVLKTIQNDPIALKRIEELLKSTVESKENTKTELVEHEDNKKRIGELSKRIKKCLEKIQKESIDKNDDPYEDGPVAKSEELEKGKTYDMKHSDSEYEIKAEKDRFDAGLARNGTTLRVNGLYHKPTGQRVGQHIYHSKWNSKTSSYKHCTADISIDPEHRRKGLANAMYSHAEACGGDKMAPTKNRTPDGKALWAQKARPFGKSEEVLEKMSRPMITFPNIKGTSTRPDQEVQVIENEKQKNLYGHKVANKQFSDVKGKFRLAGSREAHDATSGTKAYAKKISSRFGRNFLGLNYHSKTGAKSAAIAGKLRSKFEAGDEDHTAKEKEHREKRKALIEGHNKAMYEWRSKAGDLSSKITDSTGSSPEYKAWEAHREARPVPPKMPRAPSKKRVATTDLSPEKAQLRGKTVDSTIHHESLHHVLSQVQQNHGKAARGNLVNGMLQGFHPETLQSVRAFTARRGYKESSENFKEEMLTHTRDILTNPTKRDAYKKFAGDKADGHIKNMKQGYQKAYEYAKNVKIEDVKKSEDLDKPAGLNGVQGKEYLVNTQHDQYDATAIKKRLVKNDEEKANYFSNLLLKTNELNKAEKDLRGIYGAEIQPHHEEFVNWATKTLPRRNWQEWAVKNHAKDPKQFTEEAKSHINHYANSQHIPNIKAVRFDNHNVEQGIAAFKAAENQYNAKALQNPQLIKPSKGTTRFMDSSDGYSWNDHHKTSCTTIGKALGNCGNVGDEGGTKNLLSLNRKVNIGGVEHHEPAILLSLGLDGRTIRQMKGRQNTIPSAQYHKHIINLLGNSDLIPSGGGYDPGNDFHLDDLSHEEHDALIAKRPELGDYSSRVNVSAENQARIIQSGDIEKIRDLARNRNLTPEHQATLAQSKDIDVLWNLADNPNLAPEHQATLMDSDSLSVRRPLAKNPNLAPEHQATLMQSSDPNVLWYLAGNPSLAPEHQATLVQSGDIEKIRELARNRNLTPEHQATLMQSDDNYARVLLAYNPNLALEHQATLATSKDSYVLYNLSQNPNLAPEHQATLAQSDNPSILRNLATNPNLAPEHQATLAQSSDREVLRSLAENPNLDTNVWKNMYSDTKQLDKDLAEELRGRRSLVRLQAESDKNLANRKVRTAEYAKMKQTPIIKKSLSKSQSLNKANYFSNLLLNSI